MARETARSVPASPLATSAGDVGVLSDNGCCVDGVCSNGSVHAETEHRAVFHRHGLRCTKQRTVIYDALAATKLHPTADELHAMVRGRVPGLSLATVYNTLDAFAECGLIRRLPSHRASGACRYDADASNHVHAATPDGRVLDVPHDLSNRLMAGVPAALIAELEARLGVRVVAVNLEVEVESRDTNSTGDRVEPVGPQAE